MNPNYVPAINLLAELRMQEEDYGSAEQEIRRALAIDPGNLESLSLLAACQQSHGDLAGFAGTEKKVLGLNPSCGVFYHTLAENLVMRRKYRETVEQERRAVQLDPELWAAHAGLGMNLLRVGEMEQGREVIERAFRGDPFNVWAYNTLDLLDQMDTFVRAGSAHFVFLMSKEDGPVLAPYATRLAEEAYAGLTARYGFTPAGRVRVELFPDHGGFAVRTLGLPRLGALGVCFGDGDCAGLAARAEGRILQLGIDPVARIRSRHHPPDDRPQHPALVFRGHFGPRGAPRAAGLGRRLDDGVHQGLQGRKTPQGQRAERGHDAPAVPGTDRVLILPGGARSAS